MNTNFKENDLIVVTLGESTTADATQGVSWPRQLEKILIEKGYRAQVINLAEPGSNSAFQLAKYAAIQGEIPKHIVVTMLGVNDLHRNLFYKNRKNFEIKTWTLVNFFTSFFLKNNFLDQKKMNHFKSEVNVEQAKKLDEFIQIIKMKNKIDQDDMMKIQKAIPELKPEQILFYLAFKLKPPWGHEISEYRLSFELYDRLIKFFFDASIIHEYIVMANYFHKTEDCEFVVKKLIELPEVDTSLIPNLINCFDKKNYYMDQLLKKVNVNFELDSDFNVGIALKANITSLFRLVRSKNLCLLAMQYPLTPLEEMPYIDFEKSNSLYFLENKINFETALKTKKFEDLFYDRFSKNFGHTSHEGSRLLADTVFNQIEEIIQQKKCGLDLKTK